MAADNRPEAGRPDTTTARRIGNYACDGVISVTVGFSSTVYYVYKTLIAKHSEYFDRALNGNWKEAQEGFVLDNVECNTFEIFVDWLLTQKLPVKWSEWLEPGDGTKKSSQTKMVQMAMVKACVFGDRFLAQGFRNDVGHALVDLLLQFSAPYYEVITYAFNNLPDEDPLLLAMVDVHCDRTTESMDENSGDAQFREDLPHSFLLGAMMRYMNIKKNGRTALIEHEYHNQDNGVDPGQKFINDLDAAGRKDSPPALGRPNASDNFESTQRRA